MMITSRKELARRLDNGGKVEISKISKKLDRIVNLWISRKEITLNNNFLKGAF